MGLVLHVAPITDVNLKFWASFIDVSMCKKTQIQKEQVSFLHRDLLLHSLIVQVLVVMFPE